MPQFPSGSPQSASSESSECLSIKKSKGCKYVSIHEEEEEDEFHLSACVYDLQEPERSCLISSLSGMSWMAVLIFSLITFTALCHFRLQ